MHTCMHPRCMYVYKKDAFEYLTSCGLANTTMTGYEWKSNNPVVAQSADWIYQLVFSTCYNPKEANYNVSEEMNLLARKERGGKVQKLPFPMSFLQNM